MLQQTTVAAVLAGERFERFIARFPDWKALAEASDEEVLAEWAGLGYYSRARNLRAAARLVVDRHGGRLPADLVAIEDLPGVGRYTAGAVASFAFGMPVPLVDTNVARVIARLHAISDPMDGATIQRIWDLAKAMLPGDGETARLHNGALMELGALVCRSSRPACNGCPVSRYCKARKTGTEQQIPARRPKPEKLNVRMTAVAVRRKDDCVLLRRVPPGEWHAGLLSLPVIRETCADVEHQSPADLGWLGGRLPLVSEEWKLDTCFVVTRHRVRLRTHLLRMTEADDECLPWHREGQFFDWQAPGSSIPESHVWLSPGAAVKAGVGSPYRKVLSLLQSSHEPDLFRA
jgi:A/G-specific adenine glycosylase